MQYGVYICILPRGVQSVTSFAGRVSGPYQTLNKKETIDT